MHEIGNIFGEGLYIVVEYIFFAQASVNKSNDLEKL